MPHSFHYIGSEQIQYCRGRYKGVNIRRHGSQGKHLGDLIATIPITEAKEVARDHTEHRKL